MNITIGDTLAHSISEHELENIRLKRRISEPKDTLSPKPLFTKPLSIFSLDQMPQSTRRTFTWVKKVAKLLSRVRLYV
jgi:hypothetical protein